MIMSSNHIMRLYDLFLSCSHVCLFIGIGGCSTSTFNYLLFKARHLVARVKTTPQVTVTWWSLGSLY